MSQELDRTLLGKGAWIYKTHVSFERPYVRVGTPTLLEAIQIANVDHVIIKASQGRWQYRDIGRKYNLTEELVRTIKEDMGIRVYGYAFCEGDHPSSEGRTAANIRKSLGLDGMVLDVEGRFENRRFPSRNANLLLDAYRSVDPDGLLANCTWAKPDVHNPQLIATFMREGDGCSIFMPMEYYPAKKGWDLAQVGVDYMKGSYEQYQRLQDKYLAGQRFPFSPALRSYLGDGGWTDPEAIKKTYEFCRNDPNTKGGAFFTLDFLNKYGRIEVGLYKDWFKTVAELPKWNQPVPTP